MGSAIPMQGDILVISISNFVVLVVCWAIVATRLVVRWKDGLKGWDDHMMFIGMLLFTISCSFVGGCASTGLVEEHITRRKPNMYFYLALLFYIFTTLPVRWSLCMSLLRMLDRSPNKRWQRNVIYGIIMVSTLSAAVVTYGVLTIATPIKYYWDRTVPEGQLRPPKYISGFLTMFSIMSVAEDLAMGSMPSFILWNLQRSRREKMLLIILLSTSVLASGATLARLYFLGMLDNEEDGHYRAALAGMIESTLLEVFLAIVGGCAGPLKPLWESCWRRMSGNLPSTRGRSVELQTMSGYTRSG